MAKKNIEVCFSPELLHLFDHASAAVVIIDVLRATSSMCVALHNGAQHILPTATVEESMALRSQGYLVGAERQAQKVSGFDFGNSPFDYTPEKVKDKKIALTTTNGTQAIEAARGAKRLVIGSFLNLDVLTEWLIKQNSNVLCLCASWRGRFNLEDTLLAGALAQRLQASQKYATNCDSAIAAEHLYVLAQNDLFGFLAHSSHRTRLQHLNLDEEVKFCLTPNQAPVVPVLTDGFKLMVG